ncbi:peptidase family C78-domain-containing protein [Fomitopsis serialis]|uniref:peptidase family C78-domain-containing protein n=1 Tax=Fomitopsis serialis TaxID=139415 RepID=UPI002007C138|nr:peptidase family C78-domain-containing protein [Neoantrodia serialis]KAH9934838.1 peptidase family C78-domain-containing protein [Neoantrodia serialis]
MACASLMVQTAQPMYFLCWIIRIPWSSASTDLVEEAWSAGFDQEGAEQLKRHLVGTGKYIGTGELYVAFTYRGIPSQLVDFELKDGPEPLLNWVLQYFSEGTSPLRATTSMEAMRNAVLVTDKMPLVLQHDGHSRTVVGCERCPDNSINLLVFDPSRHIQADIRAAGLSNWKHGSAAADNLDTPSDSQRHASASKVLHEAVHPIRAFKAHHKRKAEDSPRDPSAKKPRGSHAHNDHDDDPHTYDGGGWTIVDQPPSTPDAGKVLNLFRLGLNRLKRKNKYQILYIPLTESLNEEQRWSRRDLTCLKVV